MDYIYLLDYDNFKKYVQPPDHINFYMFYREVEVEKRFTFGEILYSYALMLEKRYIKFDEFFITIQETYNVKTKNQKNNYGGINSSVVNDIEEYKPNIFSKIIFRFIFGFIIMVILYALTM